jgi:hypothetical protein
MGPTFHRPCGPVLRSMDWSGPTFRFGISTEIVDLLAALGFDGYFQKPSDYAAFLKLGPLVRGLLEREK